MLHRSCLLILVPFFLCGAADLPRQMKWEELPTLLGRNVSIVMPQGAAVSGKVAAIEPDVMLLHVSRTTDRVTFPKGELRVPRAGLHTLELHSKGHKFRILGTSLGFVAGVTGGAAAAIGVQGGLFSNNHQGAAAATFFGIIAGASAGGYFIGNAGDRKSVTIQVLP